MPLTTYLAARQLARVFSAIAVGALTTAAAAAGAASLITGSVNPAVWAASYQHARQCAQPAAALDPSCSAAAAKALAEQQVAQKLEADARKIATTTPPPAAPVEAPPPPPPAPAPAAAPRPAAPAPSHSDDSGGGGDD